MYPKEGPGSWQGSERRIGRHAWIPDRGGSVAGESWARLQVGAGHAPGE